MKYTNYTADGYPLKVTKRDISEGLLLGAGVAIMGTMGFLIGYTVMGWLLSLWWLS